MPTFRDQRNYKIWFLGDASSALSAAISSLPMTMLALMVTGSVRQAGFVGGVSAAMRLITILPSGWLVDSTNKCRLLKTQGLLTIVFNGALVILLVTHAITVTSLVSYAVLFGLAMGLLSGVTNTLLPLLVGKKELSEAFARNDIRDNVVYTVGAPLGGLLFGIHPALPFALLTVCGIGPLITGILLRVDDPAIASKEKARRDIFFGLKWYARHHVMQIDLLGHFLLNLGSYAALAALDLALLAHGTSGLCVGVVSAGFTVGMIVGGIVSQRIQDFLPGGRLIFWAYLWNAVFFAFTAMWLHWITATLALFVMVLPTVAVNATTASWEMLSIPRARLGTVGAVGKLAVGGLTPALAAPLAGLLLDALGYRTTALILAAVIMLAALTGLHPGIRAIPHRTDAESIPILR